MFLWWYRSAYNDTVLHLYDDTVLHLYDDTVLHFYDDTVLHLYDDTVLHLYDDTILHLYDETGLLLLKSTTDGETGNTIKSLYGIDESLQTLNKSGVYSPFIREIRADKLVGYLRLTIEKSYFTATLAKDNYNTQTLYRFLFIIAGVVGFLLTRGLNRFSRQGFRMPDTNNK